MAAEIERLISLAYADCPVDVRESLAAQFFVDAIRDDETQHALRLFDAKDLKSALAYSMKYKTTKTVSRPKQLRSVAIANDSSPKSEDKFASLMKRLEEALARNSASNKRNIH